MSTAQMAYSKSLDSDVAERVMGENLVPPRGWALTVIGLHLTSVTGKDWKLTNGKTIYMPAGETLEQPEGTDNNYNARYYAYAAEHSGEDVEALVAKVRHTPKTYSTDMNTAWLVVERLMQDHFSVNCNVNQESGYTCCIDGKDELCVSADTMPRAICLAALKAVED